MAKEKIALNFHANLRKEPDQSFTIVIEISCITSGSTSDLPTLKATSQLGRSAQGLLQS